MAAGDILVELDTRQERAQLAAAEAQRDLARINFDRTQELVKQGVTARMEFDNVNAQKNAAEAQVGEIRATIARKTIRAPFAGVLGLRQVNLGQYLSGRAKPIVPLPVAESNLRELRRAAAGRTRQVHVGRSRSSHHRRPPKCGAFSGPRYGDRLGGRPDDAQYPDTGDPGQSRRQTAPWHVCSGRGRTRCSPVRDRVCRRLPSIMLRTAIQSSSSPI